MFLPPGDKSLNNLIRLSISNGKFFDLMIVRDYLQENEDKRSSFLDFFFNIINKKIPTNYDPKKSFIFIPKPTTNPIRNNMYFGLHNIGRLVGTAFMLSKLNNIKPEYESEILKLSVLSVLYNSGLINLGKFAKKNYFYRFYLRQVTKSIHYTAYTDLLPYLFTRNFGSFVDLAGHLKTSKIYKRTMPFYHFVKLFYLIDEKEYPWETSYNLHFYKKENISKFCCGKFELIYNMTIV